MKAKNIINYVKEYGKKTCAEYPFCETDALVLSRFVYFRWAKSVPMLLEDTEGVCLSDIYENIDKEYVYKNELYPENDGKLLAAMAKSVRFGSMRCNYYSEQTDEGIVMQFGAMLCQMEGALPVILFKGTDRTLVGWKEDFYMAFSKPISGQRVAAWYLNEVAQKIEGRFIVAGHSKGGNLAAFSSMAAFSEVKDRIEAIYSFDGPGFRPEILESYGYNEIADRVKKYMPSTSLVGIVLEGSKDYTAVKCDAVTGALAHNPYKWIIEKGTFVKESDIGMKSHIMHKSLNEWIMELDEEQLQLVVNNLFGILESTDEPDFGSIIANWRSAAAKMRKTIAHMDKEQRKNILAIIKALLEELRKAYIDSSAVIEEIRQVEELIEDRISNGKEKVSARLEKKNRSQKNGTGSKGNKRGSDGDSTV